VRLALLLKANANRVYGGAVAELATAELAVLDREALGSVIRETERVELGGVEYLIADTAGTALDPAALEVLSNLSSLHAAFAMGDDGRLDPLPLRLRRCQDEDVVSIQRYAGKTNEAFTHLLVNVALAVAGALPRLLAGDRVRILDPACGRGTTLNRAIVYGADAVGVEHDARDVEAYETFLLTWLKDKRLKHTVERARLRKGRPAPAERLTVSYGASRDRSEHRLVDVVRDDTIRLRDHVRARSVDALVCDLPYGVQHGSTGGAGDLRRGPEHLLAAALPGWRDVLRPGGGVALAWNSKTLGRQALVDLLAAADLEVVPGLGDVSFEHRVDRAITRDVVLARRHA
jgi:SAM-dependent methyltransferase